MKNIKNDFPIFVNNPDLIYLDSASTLQKPQLVIDEVQKYLIHDNANIHRGEYPISTRSEELYRQARKKVKEFISADDESEIVFTSNATDGINLLAQSLFLSGKFKDGDNILISELEHHANMLPWLQLTERINIEIRRIPVGVDGLLDVQEVQRLIDSQTKLIALSACSNVTGRLRLDQIKSISTYLSNYNLSPFLVVDASQAVVHSTVDVSLLGCDFCVFTGHKLGALTGIGVLWGRKEYLKELKPSKTGGGAVEQVTKDLVSHLGSPDKFEPGTPNVVGAISLMKAIEYNQGLNVKEIEMPLIEYCLDQFRILEELGKITLLGGYESQNKIGVFSFIPQSQDIIKIGKGFLDAGIALRTGAHCTHIYHYGICEDITCGVQKTLRMSFWAYNDMQDIEAFFQTLGNVL